MDNIEIFYLEPVWDEIDPFNKGTRGFPNYMFQICSSDSNKLLAIKCTVQT